MLMMSIIITTVRCLWRLKLISWDLKEGWNSQSISFKEEMLRQGIREVDYTINKIPVGLESYELKVFEILT